MKVNRRKVRLSLGSRTLRRDSTRAFTAKGHPRRKGRKVRPRVALEQKMREIENIARLYLAGWCSHAEYREAAEAFNRSDRGAWMEFVSFN